MPDRRTNLPRTARDLFRLPLAQRVALFGAVALCEAGRFWEYPMRAFGNLERMRFIDKVYWVFKTTNPARRARRGSRLEEYFGDAGRRSCSLPTGFGVESELELSAAGDLMNHPFLARSGRCLYEAVDATLFGADVAMANLECPVLPDGNKDLVLALDAPPMLVFNAEEFAVVSGGEHRYSFMSTACNHSLDHGAAGVESTLRVLD